MAASVGNLDFLQLYTETVWGTKPTPSYVPLPVDSYSVKIQKENRQLTPQVGVFSRKYSRNFRGRPQGAIACPLWTHHLSAAGDGGAAISIAQYLCAWGFSTGSPEADVTPSKGAEWLMGGNAYNLEHNGLVVDQITLAGDESSGMVNFSANLAGKTETQVATAQTVPNDVESLPHVEFADCTIAFDGGGALDFAGFNLTQSNAQIFKYLNSTTPKLNRRGDKKVVLTVTIPKLDDAWDDALRAGGSDESSIVLTLKGLHNGTAGSGNYTQVAITMPICSLVTAPDQWARGDITYQPLTFEVLKPDSSSAAVQMVWSTPS